MNQERSLEIYKKKNLSKEVEKYKIDDLIKILEKNIKKDDDDYYYILDDTNIYLHPEGAKEVVHTVVLKILNQRGIDRYKETTLSYNSSEELIIEESQLIKSNGKKTNPEVNQNEVIWTGLEVNDIIYVKYRLKSYLYGKFAREFYDSFVFTNDIPTEISRYTLILPKDKPIFYKTLNGVLEPAISEFEDYKYYQWELINSKVIKDEPFMPPFSDIGLSLHLSTMKDWSEIAEWYSDLVYSKISDNNDYVVQEVYSKIFNDKKNLNSSEKAKLIYDYIVENISYSSVSFRQSGIIPQKASKTINTRLGDCKDISTLFVSLANLCGLKANLVLVSTRENGLKGMNLPSFNFNHCIVKYFDENQNENYLELTDRDLPFKSLPIGLYQALSLTIPSKNENSQKSDLVNLTNSNKLVDKSKCLTSLNIDGNEMQISRSLVKYGNGVSNTRNTYKSMSSENITKKMQEEVSSRFSNPIKLKKVDILGIDKLVDSVVINQEFSVTNEVKKIGNLFAFSIPFQEQIFNSTAINIPVRNYDFEYWNYENIDEYENEIVVNLPNERSFVDIPSNETFNFNNINYSISYTKVSKNKLVIKRNAQINRNNIKATDYNNFKTFVSKILEVEGAYLTFK
ncbi:MAG: DUF3857 domain-containing protein [Saprospiraceae bacterium]|nr:DUF3857 domain-containing protein [Saprospiraceae bacterium]